MYKHAPFYCVSIVMMAAFIAAGCAKQEVVKQDEGIAPPTVSRQVEQPQAHADMAPTDVTAIAPVDTQPAAAAPGEIMPSNSQVQASLDKIYFNFDSAGLSEAARNTLSQNAGVLKHTSTARIHIEGNCDERGSAEYNLALGERRAQAAHQYLVTLGIDPVRLSVISYGKEKPLVNENNEAAWSKNRRAEFVVEAQ